MKVVQFNFRRFFSCLSVFFNFLKRILFRGRQRKSSQSEDDALPTSVTVDSTDPADQVSNFLAKYNTTEVSLSLCSVSRFKEKVCCNHLNLVCLHYLYCA